MKTQLYFSFGLLLCLLLANITVQGQSREINSVLADDVIVNSTSKGFNIGMPPYFRLDKSSPKMSTLATESAKKLKLPREVKASERPIILRHEDVCYQIGGEQKGSQIIWWDRNGDGKVQLKAELRGMSKSGKAAAVWIDKIPCK